MLLHAKLYASFTAAQLLASSLRCVCRAVGQALAAACSASFTVHVHAAAFSIFARHISSDFVNMADAEFVSGDAGASKTYPIRAGEVKKGSHVIIKGHPCKVVEVTTSKTGMWSFLGQSAMTPGTVAGRWLPHCCATTLRVV